MRFVFNQVPQVDFSEIYTICQNHPECINCPVMQNQGLHMQDKTFQICNKVMENLTKEKQNGNS